MYINLLRKKYAIGFDTPTCKRAAPITWAFSYSYVLCQLFWLFLFTPYFFHLEHFFFT